MAEWVGMFFGMREGLLVGVGRICLPPWELEGKVPHALEVFTGTAGDSYSALIPFTQQSVTLLLQVDQNKAVFQLYDGEGYPDEVKVDPDHNFGSWFHRYSAKGFRIKNAELAKNADYRVVNFW